MASTAITIPTSTVAPTSTVTTSSVASTAVATKRRRSETGDATPPPAKIEDTNQLAQSPPQAQSPQVVWPPLRSQYQLAQSPPQAQSPQAVWPPLRSQENAGGQRLEMQHRHPQKCGEQDLWDRQSPAWNHQDRRYQLAQSPPQAQSPQVVRPPLRSQYQLAQSPPQAQSPQAVWPPLRSQQNAGGQRLEMQHRHPQKCGEQDLWDRQSPAWNHQDRRYQPTGTVAPTSTVTTSSKASTAITIPTSTVAPTSTVTTSSVASTAVARKRRRSETGDATPPPAKVRRTRSMGPPVSCLESPRSKIPTGTVAPTSTVTTSSKASTAITIPTSTVAPTSTVTTSSVASTAVARKRRRSETGDATPPPAKVRKMGPPVSCMESPRSKIPTGTVAPTSTVTTSSVASTAVARKRRRSETGDATPPPAKVRKMGPPVSCMESPRSKIPTGTVAPTSTVTTSSVASTAVATKRRRSETRDATPPPAKVRRTRSMGPPVSCLESPRSKIPTGTVAPTSTVTTSSKASTAITIPTSTVAPTSTVTTSSVASTAVARKRRRSETGDATPPPAKVRKMGPPVSCMESPRSKIPTGTVAPTSTVTTSSVASTAVARKRRRSETGDATPPPAKVRKMGPPVSCMESPRSKIPTGTVAPTSTVTTSSVASTAVATKRRRSETGDATPPPAKVRRTRSMGPPVSCLESPRSKIPTGTVAPTSTVTTSSMASTAITIPTSTVAPTSTVTTSSVASTAVATKRRRSETGDATPPPAKVRRTRSMGPPVSCLESPRSKIPTGTVAPTSTVTTSSKASTAITIPTSTVAPTSTVTTSSVASTAVARKRRRPETADATPPPAKIRKMGPPVSCWESPRSKIPTGTVAPTSTVTTSSVASTAVTRKRRRPETADATPPPAKVRKMGPPVSCLESPRSKIPTGTVAPTSTVTTSSVASTAVARKRRRSESGDATPPPAKYSVTRECPTPLPFSGTDPKRPGKARTIKCLLERDASSF
ncbi:mucin-2-like [Harmonia axyridis]|uniref:mucin-2-like n=1 Tax=Harmonia axyridis TaxID=115357 RepID=UPI001E27547A|nr:mucin-2-like [Harmonia axyridis]